MATVFDNPDCPVRTADAVLEVQALHFGYEPKVPVLQGVGGSLSAGRLCALIGPNAAGKSTLLRLMLGHHRPWSGIVRLGRKDVQALSPAARAALASYVPQRGAAGFTFTVAQVVAMGRHAQRPDPEAVARALDTCDLASVMDRPYLHLSAGQQQRVLLARAIAQSGGTGRVMLLDEPGSAMDLRHLHRTMKHLRELAAAGLAVLVVLHDLNLAAHYADDVWLLDEGRLAARGPVLEVMKPAVLEPVYRMKLQPIWPEGRDRPIFVAGLGGAETRRHEGN